MAKLNNEQRNFRVFGPDERLSNGLEALFEVTQRQWDAATAPNDEFLAPAGRVLDSVLSDLDRFHLVMDTIDRLSQTGDRGVYLKQQLTDKPIEHKQCINKHGQDLPEIRNWKWSNPK